MSERASAAELLVDAARPLLVGLLEPIERRLDKLEQPFDQERSREWHSLAEASQRFGVSYEPHICKPRRKRLEVRQMPREV